LNRNDIWKFGTLTVSPFDWLEASYFYYRPSDLVWEGDLVAGHYLDKGFNVKFVHRSKRFKNTKLAIGLDDFAGTGLLTKEYIVSTTQLKNIKFTAGMGWGKFTGENTASNPLNKISDKFKNRPSNSDNFDKGGNLSYDLWFKGESSIFGGIEYKFPKIKGLKFILEYDPFDYSDFSANNRPDINPVVRRKDKKYNFGFNYPINKYFSLGVSQIKGNQINLGLSFSLKLREELFSKPNFEPRIVKDNQNKKNKKVFYDDLLFNLNNNNLLLQTATLDNEKLDISISTSQHRNAIRSSSYASNIAKKVADLNEIRINQINISHINVGIELNNITYVAKHLDEDNSDPIEVKKYYTSFDPGDPKGYEKNEFKPLVDFPVVFQSFSPTIISHIGVPEKFYAGNLVMQYNNETQFNRNLILNSELNYSLYTNIKDTISGPGSQLEHVRTDLVDYLKEDDFFITRIQLDYIWSPKQSLYTKISGGIFETMFGGIGGEILYKPFDRNFTLGAELFKVRQRAFNQKLEFKDYETTTGHLNFGLMMPLGIEANISYGRYLAKDDGYTFDLSRRTKSGFRAGIYFTRTNISAELFGEGSFDKGFYFQIPFDLISGDYDGSYNNFELSPLTRDGGAKLRHNNDLKGLIYNSSYREINSQWGGFLK
tara:strand:- start:681 stop:2645 length:1965 start_codon:yes stop_codon:yes gene_type:complete